MIPFGFLGKEAAGGGGGLSLDDNQATAYNTTQGKSVSVTASSGDLLVAWAINGNAGSSTFTPSASGVTFTEANAGDQIFCHTGTATGNHTVTFTSSVPAYNDPNIGGCLVFSGHDGLGNSGTAGGWAQDTVTMTVTAGSYGFVIAGASAGGTITGWATPGTETEITLQVSDTLGCAYASALEGGSGDFGPTMSAAAVMAVFALEILEA